MRIVAEKVRGRDLLPGDLFSSFDFSTYWTDRRNPSSIGERVYIRTETPLREAQLDEVVWRVEVER